MFTTTPRWFGYPVQEYVTSKEGLDNLIQSVNGRGPCFVSEYVYPRRSRLIFDKIFNDFDDKGSLKGPYYSCNRLLEFNESLNNPVTIVFSGSKGYHLHMALQRSKVTAIELWAMHYSLYKELGLTYSDKHCFGVLRQIARVPTTLHVNKFGEVNGRYCRYLTTRDFKKGILYTIKLSKDPGVLPEPMSSTLSFKELTEHVKCYPEVLEKALTREPVAVEIERTREHISSVNVVAPTCLNVGIQELNPTHITRFETTCWLKFIGFTNNAILELYDRMDWRDYKDWITKYMINRTRPRLPMCNKLEVVTDKKYCGDCPLSRIERNGGRDEKEIHYGRSSEDPC